MMASMPAQFPGMPGHTGIPHGGQPMVHGHPSNQGMPGGQQPVVTMGQPMHHGMAGPGVPQVNQAGPMMGGMMPGGGPPGAQPSAHALSHLNPNQGPLMQRQQQLQQAQAMANPAMVDQQRQHQAMMQHRAMLQQQQNGGMVTQNGNPPMSQAQFLPGNPSRISLTPHLQQLQQIQQQAGHQQQLAAHQQQQQHMRAQAQQAAMQQQQHQQNASAQHQAQQAHQQAHQQAQQQAQQQQAIAQHMASIQQAASQAGPTQGQPAPQQSLIATPQMSGAQDNQTVPAAQRQQSAQQAQMQSQAQQQQAQHAQQQAHQAQQQAHQHAQQQQAHQQQQQAAQQQQVQQQQQQAQPQSQQPQSQQPPQQQQPQQQQQQTPQQQHAQAQQQAQIHQHQQAAAAAAMMQGPRMQKKQGDSLLQLHQFSDALSQASVQNQSKELSYWKLFVEMFFSPDGVLRQTTWSSIDKSDKSFELQQPSLPRYYLTHFQSGVKNIQMIFEQANEKNIAGGGRYIECPRTCVIYWFENGHQLVATGNMRAQFNSQQKIDVLDLVTTEHTEYIPRENLVQSQTQSPELKHSPNISKAGKRAQQRQQKQQEEQRNQPPQAPVPKSIVNEWGATSAVWQLLELAETISAMTQIIQFSHIHPDLSPADALSQLCSNPSFTQPLPQPNFNAAFASPFQQPPHPTPQQAPHPFAPPTTFLSPAQASHLALPAQNHNTHSTASPATLSNHNTPSMTHLPLQHPQLAGSMPAPPPGSAAMAHQASHQGTNPSAAGTPAGGGSANASPSVGITGKRRRASGVDGMEEMTGVNGIGGPGRPGQVGVPGGSDKVKQSPKGGTKKQRGGQG